MAKARRKAETQEEEIEVRGEIDYDNVTQEYEAKKKEVELAVDMIEIEFWRRGFKDRRDTLDKTHKNHMESMKEENSGDYDSVEYVKALNKTKLAFSKAVNDFDNYVSDVQTAVDKLHIFCNDEDLALFDDLPMMTATFSRKTGKITMTKVK